MFSLFKKYNFTTLTLDFLFVSIGNLQLHGGSSLGIATIALPVGMKRRSVVDARGLKLIEGSSKNALFATTRGDVSCDSDASSSPQKQLTFANVGKAKKR